MRYLIISYFPSDRREFHGDHSPWLSLNGDLEFEEFEDPESAVTFLAHRMVRAEFIEHERRGVLSRDHEITVFVDGHQAARCEARDAGVYGVRKVVRSSWDLGEDDERGSAALAIISAAALSSDAQLGLKLADREKVKEAAKQAEASRERERDQRELERLKRKLQGETP